MPDILFKVYYNDEVASREQLERIEEIVVEQEENASTDAQVKIPMCTDERGRWNEGDDELLATLERIRVEVKVGDNPFVALIDGPVVGYNISASSQPGQSAVTFLVRDDSVYLNRVESVEIFEEERDYDVVTDMLGRPDGFVPPDVDDFPDPESSVEKVRIRRGTEMDLLLQLARRHNMYVAVLPGEDPGESQGVFKRFPTEGGDLPPLVLLGPERNVESMEIKERRLRPARVSAATLRIGDRAVFQHTSSFHNRDLLGDKHAFREEEESATGQQLLSPDQGEAVDQRRVDVESDRSTYKFDASGEVSGMCYGNVLTPYQLVRVETVKDQLVGHYRISEVTHTITRSVYTQSFKLKRNAVTESTDTGSRTLSPFQ